MAGIRRFRREAYPQHQEAYQAVMREGQRPHALLITCADSRVDPEMLTQSGPGEIFVSRNIGNLVPAYGEMLGGVSAVIEYAVTALDVSHVVVCGHSDCGAMKGLIRPEQVGAMPTVTSWLRNAEAALSAVRARNTAGDERNALEELIEENVLLQMSHLRTHPSIAGKLATGDLAVSGWVYDIADGIVRTYYEQEQRFISVGANDGR